MIRGRYSSMITWCDETMQFLSFSQINKEKKKKTLLTYRYCVPDFVLKMLFCCSMEIFYSSWNKLVGRASCKKKKKKFHTFLPTQFLLGPYASSAGKRQGTTRRKHMCVPQFPCFSAALPRSRGGAYIFVRARGASGLRGSPEAQRVCTLTRTPHSALPEEC